MRKILLLVVLLLLFFSTTATAEIIVSDVYPSIGAKNIDVSGVILTVTINSTEGTFDYRIECSNGQFTTGTNSTNGTYILELNNLKYNTKYWWNVIVDNESFSFYFTTKSAGHTEEITIFPEKPVSGKTFAIVLNERINTAGYVYVGDTLYPINIQNGFGTVTVDETTYGDAVLWLYGVNSSDIQKSFYIDVGIEGSLGLDTTDVIKVNEVLDATITVGGKPIKDVEVIFVSPDNKEIVLHTDSEGKVSHIMDMVGLWLIKCSFLGQNVVKEINVEYKPLGITCDNNKYVLGDDVRIETEENTVLDITKDGVIKFQGLATNGILVYTPNEPGNYRVTGVLNNKKGTVDFTVYQEAFIKVYNLDNLQVQHLSTGEKYMVKVVDSRDRPLSDFKEIYYDFSKTIPLTGGIGFWTPITAGNIQLTLPDLDGFVTNNINLLIEGKTENTAEINIYGILFVVGIFIVLLLYIFRDKLPDSIKDIFYKGLKPKREIPI